jgi:sarcosine oxidase
VTEFVDTIVAGGGTAGSAAVWQLARRGTEVLLVDDGANVDEDGTTAPDGRAFEPAWADPVHQALAAESSALWSELEAATGSQVLDRIGAVLHGHGDRVGAAAESLARTRLADEVLSATEAEARWPGLRFSGSVLFAPHGGRLREPAAIAALRSAAVAEGARVATGETITRIRILGDDLARVELRSPATGEVDSGDGVHEIDCRRLVVALGPATARLLRGLVTLPRLAVAREVSVVLPVAAELPAVVHLTEPGAPGQRYWRGDAAALGGAGTVSLGWRDAAAVSTAALRPGALPPRELAALLRYAREWVPGADPDVLSVTSRLRTTAADGDFVVDRIGPVIVGAGFGAGGASLAPAIGRLLTGLADGIPAPARFALRPDRRRGVDPLLPVVRRA